ncbi:MAG: UxaA family hydrolase [Rhodospirillaceae bacterium]|jgi:altronate dehydratase small subunit|nr:UxaA family hydrolase [Rhodospirillaceae bacterium]MBT5298061.1 UxaA family hydrolase [Rhodospirillaceae bacterium]MBT5513608.1 UxaA family hydrolase [Rhodospirillaceae bacterium]MBT6087593.1 UxaA family hydrolase [Rhodospirillaceae bacterium]MBT6608982.1 UxaA family hydrolase [Rhodospirillaceae bacterium]
MDKIIVLGERDNVATCLADFDAGSVVHAAGLDVALSDAIQFGHKFALTDIAAGAEICKYGEVIGVASVDIAIGQHVHVHNIESVRARGDKANGDQERGDKS